MAFSGSMRPEKCGAAMNCRPSVGKGRVLGKDTAEAVSAFKSLLWPLLPMMIVALLSYREYVYAQAAWRRCLGGLTLRSQSSQWFFRHGRMQWIAFEL